MPLKIYISTANNPRGSVVVSQLNPTPTQLPDFVLGNIRDTNIYLVDGLGSFDAISGDDDYTLSVGIGIPGSGAASLNTTWTANGTSHYWNGNIAINTDALADLFDSLDCNPIEPTLEIRVTDTQSRIISETLIPIKIWKRVIDPEDLVNPPSPSNADGEFEIADASDFGAVTGLNLAAVPRRVLVSVRKPVGGSNIFACVESGTITTDGFQFTLSGVTDAATYKLDYYLIF